MAEKEEGFSTEEQQDGGGEGLRGMSLCFGRSRRDWCEGESSIDEEKGFSIRRGGEGILDQKRRRRRRRVEQDAGAECREEEGTLCITVLHPLAPGATVDDDELDFLCVQLLEGLAALGQRRGLDAPEIVQDE